MRRAVASSLLSLLLVTTLLWGGCISCEKYFMFQNSKDCCDSHGQCKRKAPAKQESTRECRQIAFDHDQAFPVVASLPVTAVLRVDAPVRLLPATSDWHSLDPVDTSPPDLQALHSVFLI